MTIRNSMHDDSKTDGQDLVAFIGGSGRSGSTLIDLMLNNHPSVQSVGEVHRLNLYARENNEPCTCGSPVSECPFWLEVESEVRRRLGWSAERHPLHETEIMLVREDVHPTLALMQKAMMLAAPRRVGRWMNGLLAPAHQRAIEMSLVWHDAIRSVTGTSVIIDSSKDARRLKALYLNAPGQFRLINMVRDGRAVSASAIRRTGMSMKQAAYEWKRSQRHTRLSSYGIPSGKKMMIHYEALCRDPEATMTKACAFLGVRFHPEMLTLRKSEAHNIGGNPMRFKTGDREIKLDERWREQLSEKELLEFDRVAGDENRRLGYDS